MGIPSKQIGQSAEANLLWNISKQLEYLTKVTSQSGGGGGTFDGQLTQGGSDVSTSNPLPVEGGLADTTFQDSTGQLFVYRDNGVDTPIAYKIPEWTVYAPVGAVTATSSPLTNYALEAGGKLESIDTKLGSAPMQQTGGSLSITNFPATQPVSGPLTDAQLRASAVPVSLSAIPLATGASTSALQTTGNTSLSSIATQTIDVPNVIGTEGGTQPTKGVVVMGHTGAGVVRHILVDNNGVQRVNVNNSALPTGAATEAKQDTGNTSLANIDTDLGAVSDAAWSGTGNASLIAIQKALFAKFNSDANGNLRINTSATTFTYSPNNSTNGNSSIFVLANGATWNGTLENTINQPYLVTSVNSNQNVTLTITQFIDAAGTIKAVPDIVFLVTANIPYPFPLAVQGNYIRLSVTNSSGSSANLYVDSYYGSLPVQPNSLTQLGNFRVAIQEPLPGGNNRIGQVISTTGQPTVTPTVTASTAYTAGNLVGSLMTFPNSFAVGSTSGVLQSIVIRSRSVQTTAFKLYIFSQQPTNTTWTDRTAPSINALDLPFLIDYFVFAAPDSGLGTMTIYAQDGLGKSLVNTVGNTSLWGVLVCVGTPTFTSTSDISVTLGILQD